MNSSRRTEALEQIRDEVLALESSPLFAYRAENKYLPVLGEGSHEARIVFIGEAPGENEAKTGRPFCGRAGQVLETLLQSVGLERKDIYITNIVKDRPPKNRDPLPEEIEVYAPFLDRQLEIIKPAVIATLGRFSMVYIMKRYGLEKELGSISVLHGKVFTTETSWGEVKFVPLYHPAAAIYNQELIKVLEQDFKLLTGL
jgi:uracil-DNA glycosylase